jgi:nicotinamidase-related amidase
MQVDSFDRHSALASQRAELVSGINGIANAFRKAGQPVIWVRQEFQPDLGDAFLEVRRTGARVTIAGTEGCSLLPELERHETDYMVIKKRYSAFFQTGLDELLEKLNTTTLVVAGINTHACVRTSVIDAYQRDYDVVLALQCTGSHDAEHHDVTVRYLNGKMARVLSNDEVMNFLSPATGV